MAVEDVMKKLLPKETHLRDELNTSTLSNEKKCNTQN